MGCLHLPPILKLSLSHEVRNTTMNIKKKKIIICVMKKNCNPGLVPHLERSNIILQGLYGGRFIFNDFFFYGHNFVLLLHFFRLFSDFRFFKKKLNTTRFSHKKKPSEISIYPDGKGEGIITPWNSNDMRENHKRSHSNHKSLATTQKSYLYKDQSTTLFRQQHK